MEVKPVDTSKIKAQFKDPAADRKKIVSEIAEPKGVEPDKGGVISALLLSRKSEAIIRKLADWVPSQALSWILSGMAQGMKVARDYYGYEKE